MNDYERLVEDLDGAINAVETCDADDSDLIALLDEAEEKLREAQQIARARA